MYYDLSSGSSFGGPDKLHAVNKQHPRSEIKKWLSGQDTYTLHRQARKNFPRNAYHVTNVLDLVQGDLIDLSSLSNLNDDFKFLLTVIDVFSKKGAIKPLKNKYGTTVADALKEIFENDFQQAPEVFQTDKGKEFMNRHVKKLLDNLGVKQIFTNDPIIKASIVERFNRTIMAKLFKFLTYKNNFRYIDALNDLVEGYNNAKHRTIGRAPNEVNDGNILDVYNKAFAPKKSNEKVKNKFNVGDYVRVSRMKHVFEKKYTPNFSMEVFKIAQVIKRSPVVYKLQDLQNEEISGVFYEPELVKVLFDRDSFFKIEKVIKKRIRNGQRQLFVKFLGYPEKFNDWVLESDVQNII